MIGVDTFIRVIVSHFQEFSYFIEKFAGYPTLADWFAFQESKISEIEGNQVYSIKL